MPRPNKQIYAASRSDHRGAYRAAVNARVASALASETPFTERLVHFWANHVAISADKVTTVPFAGSFENEAIRPHIIGNFGRDRAMLPVFPA
jgi:uncharacterized protein (DUF1800 family)